MRAPVIRRVANPLSVWIAMLAIVLQSLMPMAAQARMRMGVQTSASPAVAQGADHAMPAKVVAHHLMGPTSHDAASPVETAEPPAAHAAAHDAPPPNPHAMHGDAPCPYCRVHLDAVSLPPVPNPHWVLLVSVVPRPIADEAVPVTAEPWTPTHPRGPPLIA